jgi:predicted O-methyltransferase YrrM
MQMLDKKIEDYCIAKSNLPSADCDRIEAYTKANVHGSGMLIGKMEASFIGFLLRSIEARRVLELGTYTGYSALCLVDGLVDGGKLITIDINEEISWLPKKYFELSGKNHQIDYLIGNALEIIPTLSTLFDLVFIDADKVNYANYYDIIIDKMPIGGYILADNVLWSGHVIDSKKQDEDTVALRLFNDKVHQDERVENVMLPIRDGIMVMRKVS